MPTPIFSARVPPHHHTFLHAVIKRLREDDAKRDPTFAQTVQTLLADPEQPVDDRLARLERQVARLQGDFNALKSMLVLPPDPNADPDLVVFGEKVRAAREALGLSQPKLAAQVNIHPRTLRMVEKGRDAHPNTLRPIAEALKLEVPERLLAPRSREARAAS
jgi:ribosome-binding protein aMBF1 (putative translation factor)